MKIRNGFVSNSSSSSFVVLGYCFDDLKTLMSTIGKCLPEEWKKFIFDVVVENGLDPKPMIDAIHKNEKLVIDAFECKKLNKYELIYGIIHLLNFNDYLLNGNDCPIYIGNPVDIYGKCEDVIKSVNGTNEIMTKAKYYDPENLRIHVLFASHSSEYYQPIEDIL